MSVAAPSVGAVLISAREASRMLHETAALGRQQSRRVLLSGLAGPSVRAGGSLLYDAERVADLGRWTSADHAALLAACRGGVFVLRLGRHTPVSVLDPWAERAAGLRVQADVGFAARLQARAHLAAYDSLPFVATVCGFPVLCGDLASLRGLPDDRVELGLEPAGAWQHVLEARRLVTSPGPPWLLLGRQPYLGRAQRAHDRGEPVGAGRSTTWSRWA
jgi:hypothetical protein